MKGRDVVCLFHALITVESSRSVDCCDAFLPGYRLLDVLLDSVSASTANVFHGVATDLQSQRELLGPFARRDQAVLPLIRINNKLQMDLRFAKFVEDEKPELLQLRKAGHVLLLEMPATGKTSTIFDYGRGEYLIYIRCAQTSGAGSHNQPTTDHEFSV